MPRRYKVFDLRRFFRESRAPINHFATRNTAFLRVSDRNDRTAQNRPSEGHRHLPIFPMESPLRNRRFLAVEEEGGSAISQIVFSKALYIVKSLEKQDTK
jgi:hypothetical protein